MSRATVVSGTFLAVNRQLLELESCSNHLQIWQVLWLKSKKNCFSFSVGASLGMTLTIGGVLETFGQPWPALGSNLLSHSFDSKFY